MKGAGRNSDFAADRRYFIGGSDARIIMGDDEAALIRLWKEKRGEIEPEDLSGNLIVQLGAVTEDLNRRWYEANTGQIVTDVQKHIRHPGLRWMAATLDGRVESSGAVFEAKFMLPWYFSEEAAAEKYAPQLQHNMWVVAARTAVLSVITGGGKWVEITTHADPLYQHLIITAERKFWRCVENGEPPALPGYLSNHVLCSRPCFSAGFGRYSGVAFCGMSAVMGRKSSTRRFFQSRLLLKICGPTVRTVRTIYR